MSILITGGTGTLGRRVVKHLRAGDVEPRVLSRRGRPDGAAGGTEWSTGDLHTGQGLTAALAGVHTVIHCATTRRGDEAAVRNLISATRNQTSAGSGAAQPHMVYVSIVGVDRIPLDYYRAKLEVEHLIEACGLPYTILRATQFHHLIRTGCSVLARSPIMPIPSRTSFQPIDPDEVALRLVELASSAPSGRAPDIGGPQVVGAATLARSFLNASHVRRRVLPVRIPGAVAAGYRRGDHLTPDRAVGRITFEDFLRRARSGR